MGEVTEEEIIDIANNFLLSSPPGEFMEVVTDVRTLLPNESLINESAPRTFREYNTEQMIAVDSPGHSHNVLITKYGEVSDGEYLDPRGGQVVKFDHIKQEVVGQRPIGDELDGSLESLRAAFDKAASAYTEEHYPNGTSTVYGKDGQIIVCISAARFNPNNFWNGRWRATWTFHGGQLEVHYRIQVHYYEDGNVQLNTDTKHKLNIQESGSPDKVAEAALKAIAKQDAAYQASLEQSYATMGDTTFKALRRQLPITRQKIDWQKIRQYRLGSDMTNKN